MRFPEEACAWPIGEEVDPPLDISTCFLVDGDVVVDGSYSGAEVDQASKEYSSWGDHLASECQFPDQREQLFLGTCVLASEFR